MKIVVQSIEIENLVANNFVFDNTNKTIFEGLDCLQRNFPCNTSRFFQLYHPGTCHCNMYLGAIIVVAF
ncbi:hypothetical protein CK203_025049 [Vitis vinifera]|uniref:Uncharacterized protein n=1 Tax=Vitis vinifera TaxID=29760 RepID=A0A438J709_VITVI|nr:hypothetical protein CK203_025049 [Vitis vinifera]